MATKTAAKGKTSKAKPSSKKAARPNTNFLANVLNKYKMSDSEKKELYSKIDKTIARINAEAKKQKTKLDVILGGSASKGTMLKGDFDVDLFVRFDYSYKKSDISELLASVLKSWKPIRINGSRDYFQFEESGVNYEVVPVLRIKDHKDAINVTDASPLHVEWVRSHTKKNPKLLDEIILAKVFLKANRLYGAESYISGYSGHVVDILVINYGGFDELIKAMAERWHGGTVIDPEMHYRGKSPILNHSKLGPLILIDPIQPDRNAAAAVSLETFQRTIATARAYLKGPSIGFFEKRVETKGTITQKAGKDIAIVLEVELNEEKADVNGARLVKVFDMLVIRLEKADFVIINKGWEWDKSKNAMIWFIIDSAPLSSTRTHPGPPLTMKDHAARFKATYKNTHIKDGIIYAEVKREYTDPKKLVDIVIKDNYVKEKVKRIKRI